MILFIPALDGSFGEGLALETYGSPFRTRKPWSVTVLTTGLPLGSLKVAVAGQMSVFMFIERRHSMDGAPQHSEPIVCESNCVVLDMYVGVMGKELIRHSVARSEEGRCCLRYDLRPCRRKPM
jgi:hypothetical protein